MSKNPAKISKNSRYKQGNYVPKFPEKYLGDPKNIPYRSGWEQKVCYKLDHAPYVIAWCIEPAPIQYLSPKDGLPHRYFPDFLTVTINKDGTKNITLIEVKPSKEQFPPSKQGKKKSRYLQEALTYEINQAKWNAARALCKKKGWNFVILTEKEILGTK